MLRNVLSIAILIAIAVVGATGQTTEIAYQGQLQNGGVAANGSYDLELRLFDSLAGGLQVGPLITRTNVPVINGLFSVQADFGSVFPGADRYIEIRVRTAGGGIYTPLTPRQRINSSPYNVKSLTSDNASSLGGVTANQYVVTGDPRLTDSRNPLAGSASYVQNTTSPQAATNFNISGNGTIGGTLTAGNMNATAQFNIGGSRVLSIAGTSNTFAGINAGVANTGSNNAFFGSSAGTNNATGIGNAFFGSLSGSANTTGGNNSFFGLSAGNDNTSGGSNSFFGSGAGAANTIASGNAFFGTNSGLANTTGLNNSFFGASSGLANTTAGSNTFIGVSAGRSTTTGSENTFLGTSAGFNNTTGNQNTFLGRNAGRANLIGISNTFAGHEAGFSNTASHNSFFGALAGNANTTGADNSFFGNNAGTVNTTGFNNAFFGADAGAANTVGEVNSFFGVAAGKVNTTGTENTFVGTSAGFSNTQGNENTFVGRSAGRLTTTGSGNTFVGLSAGLSNTVGNNNTLIGAAANITSNIFTPSYRTAIGAGAEVANDHTIVLGRASGADGVEVPGSLDVAGTSSFDLASFAAGVTMRQSLKFLSTTFPTGGYLSLCTKDDATNTNNIVADCSSSIRYKTNITPFLPGLDLVKLLRPINFNWIDGGKADFGLIAEEVAAVEPLLASYKNGQVEGVKYDRIGVVLINALQEQQRVIDQLTERDRKQQLIIDRLVRSICKQNANDAVCTEEK